MEWKKQQAIGNMNVQHTINFLSCDIQLDAWIIAFTSSYTKGTAQISFKLVMDFN